jgi:sugar phosphate permease
MGIISLSYQAGFMDATMAIANTWFIRRRALAMSLTSGSIALGGTLLTPFLAYAVHAWGWRVASIGAGIAFLVGGLPLALLIRRSPESIGLLPDGVAMERSTIEASGKKPKPTISVEREFTLSQTLRTHQFWLLTFATSFRTICSSSILVHLVPILVWKGYTQQQAALCLSIIAVCGMPTHLLIGWLGDWVDKSRLMATAMVIASVSIYLLFESAQEWLLGIGLVLFSVLEGLFPVTWATVGDYFGRRNFAKIRGSMSFLYTWGSVVGPVIAGAIFDRTQSYGSLLWVLLGLCWITAILYVVLAPPDVRKS